MKRVQRLSDLLRENGIDSHIDQYYTSPAEGWPKWMERWIIDADFIILVCTESYSKRVQGQQDRGTGLGVCWESTLIYQQLYNTACMNGKFIPIVLKDDDAHFIPLPLQGSTYYCIKRLPGRAFKALLDRLFERVKVEMLPLPPLPVVPETKLLFSTIIDGLQWKDAGWKSMLYAWESEDAIPLLGIVFENEGKAIEIFEYLRQRIGGRDFYEELRISIIEGDLPGEDPGYTVLVATDVRQIMKRVKEGKAESNFRFAAQFGIMHRFHPKPGSVHLQNFKRIYSRHMEYLLVPAVSHSGELSILDDYAIRKNVLHLRTVDELRDLFPCDPDCIILRPKPPKEMEKMGEIVTIFDVKQDLREGEKGVD